MRIATLILAVLFILGGGVLGMVRMDTNFKHAKTMQKDLDGAEKIKKLVGPNHKLAKQVDSYKGKPGRVKVGGVLMLSLGLLGLILLVVTFMKKSPLVLFGTLAVIALALVTVFINPDYEVGITSAGSARTGAWIVGIPIFLGALLALASDRLRLRKEAKAA